MFLNFLILLELYLSPVLIPPTIQECLYRSPVSLPSCIPKILCLKSCMLSSNICIWQRRRWRWRRRRRRWRLRNDLIMKKKNQQLSKSQLNQNTYQRKSSMLSSNFCIWQRSRWRWRGRRRRWRLRNNLNTGRTNISNSQIHN